MKIILSKAQWEQIGRTAGWGVKDSWTQELYYQEDQIKGEEYRHPGLWYEITLKGEFRVDDVSDYDRETGYGHMVEPHIQEISEFLIQETDENGKIIRDQDQIENGEPELYKELRSRAKTGALEKFEEQQP